MTVKEIKEMIVEKLEADFNKEVIIHVTGEYSYEALYKAINDDMNSLMENGNEHVYMFASCLIIDDKSTGGEPMDLWIKYY